MLVVAVVFLIIGGVSTAVRLSEICNDYGADDYCFDNNYTIRILSSAVSIIALKARLFSPFWYNYTKKERVRFCETMHYYIQWFYALLFRFVLFLVPI